MMLWCQHLMLTNCIKCCSRTTLLCSTTEHENLALLTEPSRANFVQKSIFMPGSRLLHDCSDWWAWESCLSDGGAEISALSRACGHHAILRVATIRHHHTDTDRGETWTHHPDPIHIPSSTKGSKVSEQKHTKGSNGNLVILWYH